MSALHAAAQGAVEQMALSLAGGSALAAAAWAALRLAPRQSSRARFTLWFGVLIAIAILPLMRGMAASGEAAASASRAWLTIPESWTVYIFGFWAVMACAGLMRVAAGLWQVHRVRASCEEIPLGELPSGVVDTLARFSSRRAVRLCVSDAVRVPTAVGFLRPAVVIPRWLFAELPAAELNQVVLHELAHLARRDDWTNLAQKTLKAALFFHPAVWWIDRRLSLEREMACDDAVIAAIDDRHSYAQCLTMLAEKTLGRRTASLAQAAVHRLQQVTARVMRILEPQAATAHGKWAWAVTAVSTLAVGGAIAFGGSTPLIGFQPTAAPLAQTQPAEMPLSRPGVAKIVPAAMHVAEPVAQTTRMVHRERKKAVRMMASRRAPEPMPQWSPSVTGNVIPAKAALDVQQRASDVVVFTVFTTSPDAQSWNLEVWHVTVYTPAPAPPAAPRKTT
jgi:beta-lactamase regulating signal transducer with metallopeptidase domain